MLKDLGKMKNYEGVDDQWWRRMNVFPGGIHKIWERWDYKMRRKGKERVYQMEERRNQRADSQNLESLRTPLPKKAEGY